MGEDLGVKSKLGGNDWDVESEKAKGEDEGVLTFREKDEKEDLSVGGFGGGPCERDLCVLNLKKSQLRPLDPSQEETYEILQSRYEHRLLDFLSIL
ncbi:hypothetical protein L1987_27374 [Smallanthus sonchifolius]|uniref:Uncharacterized protein n=1 Tax=Smallanthus sonchifolius TaxID=185202 RepID=A0ACB9IBQ8_9ASTR|nr:hypothetical protein L1987_27374 [Smallanthus sonchifolius]